MTVRGGFLAAVMAVAVLALGAVASAQADPLFNESFLHPTVTASGLVVGAAGGGRPFRQVS